MTLHPQARAVIDAFAGMNLSAPDRIPVAEARLQYMRGRACFLAPEEALSSVEDRVFAGPASSLSVRIYRPLTARASEVLPALVFFHGGGWVFGNLDSHDRLCRSLANGAQCCVVAVDYRLAPEHRFPAAVDDATAAIGQVIANAEALRIDPRRIAAAGDSAGGNLVAVAALQLRDRGGPRLALQTLLYPVTDLRMGSASYRTLGSGYLLTAERMRYFAQQYLNDPAEAVDWRASPLLAPSLAGLPPALVITASHDPLVDEGKAYADRLAEEGATVRYVCYPGMIHGFMTMAGALDGGREAVAEVAAALRDAFS